MNNYQNPKMPNQPGLLNSRKHKQTVPLQKVTFNDVAGIDEAKEDLQEIVEFLRNPFQFLQLGARLPRGVLLVGPPGTGKTLLARAVAGEANTPFFSTSASEFIELFVGMGAMRVRDLFAQAKREAPAIIFIDEIDAVAKGRQSRLGFVGNDEREQTLNQLLTELDGFESGAQSAVVVIAATNRPDVLDPALLRPGRFDRRVTVERPDRLGRQQILQVHVTSKKLPLHENVKLEEVAAGTTGFTGADLANIVNEAALMAARSKRKSVEKQDFEKAVLRSIMGVERKRQILGQEEKEVVARHESGHALVATALCKVLSQQSAVQRLSIVPLTGGALGFTYTPPQQEDRSLIYDGEIRGQLCLLMGGRAAEELTCQRISTGAVDDIRRATTIAQRSVGEYGLNKSVGALNVGVLNQSLDESGFGMGAGSNPLVGSMFLETKLLIDGALEVARNVVELNRELHQQLSEELAVKEKMDEEQLKPFLDKIQVPDSLIQFIDYSQVPQSVFQQQPQILGNTSNFANNLLPQVASNGSQIADNVSTQQAVEVQNQEVSKPKQKQNSQGTRQQRPKKDHPKGFE